jgi:thiosulfate reductase cytochrome b subunit
MPGIDALLSVFDETESRGRYKKAIYAFMGFLLVYVVVRGVVGAHQRPFWIDELCTLAIAGQPTLHDLWTAVNKGFDSAPPLFYLVERVALKLVSSGQVALRLPSILAFPCTLV